MSQAVRLLPRRDHRRAQLRIGCWGKQTLPRGDHDLAKQFGELSTAARAKQIDDTLTP
jgi:hypothetical protein